MLLKPAIATSKLMDAGLPDAALRADCLSVLSFHRRSVYCRSTFLPLVAKISSRNCQDAEAAPSATHRLL
jgi:hypothetical protein